MISLADFKDRCKGTEPEELFDELILNPSAAFVTQDDISHLRQELSNAFMVQPKQLLLYVTGSAKFGYSITEKRRNGQLIGSRYRNFSIDSDIDIAVVSAALFGIIWHDISRYSHSSQYFPRRANKLGDYIVYGWLRPDKFPTHTSVRYCNLWWEMFQGFSKQERFKYHKVRGALFYSIEQFKLYACRSIAECVRIEGGIDEDSINQ